MGFITAPLDIALSAAFESKPDVPQFHWTDLVSEQMKTAQGNLGVLPTAEKLGTGVNDFLRGERAKTLAGIPGLSDIEGQTTANLKSWLAGELSPELAGDVARRTNAAAFAGGYGAGGGNRSGLTMDRAAQGRNYGLTGYGMQQAAMPLANQYMTSEANMRRINEFDPTSMFMDPMKSATFNAAQQNQAWNRDWLASRVDAQPEPWQRQWMSDVNGLDAFLGTTAGTVGGEVAGAGAAQAAKGGSY